MDEQNVTNDVMQPAMELSEEMCQACEALCHLLDASLRGPAHSEPRYVISVASRMVGIEAHRLRHYERLGFVRPGRSDGNTRLYSQEDVDHLCCVKTLMNDLGVNSAGVQFALALMRRMENLQGEVTDMSSRLGKLERRRRSGNGTQDSSGEE
ncbi:MAG: MerR family transcriptional regulator [Dehalococcoidia bacterium]|nr:MerR family transcriptional regulator [Dehalococcoidia bacterium]